MRTSRIFSTQGTVIVADDSNWWEQGSRANNMMEIYDSGELIGELTRAKDKLVVVYFYRPSCHACHALHPKFCKLASENPDVVFLKVHFDEHATLCEHMDVTQLPFFHFYKGARGRVAAFPASIATFQRLRGTVERERLQMCSLGRRRVATRLAKMKTVQMSTKERLKMKRAMMQAMDGTSLAMPSLWATRWVEVLDAEYEDMRKQGAIEEVTDVSVTQN